MFGRRGFSLVGVLVAFGILFIGGYMLMRGLAGILQTRTQIWGRDEISQIDDALRDIIAQQLGQFMETLGQNCGGAGVPFEAINWATTNPRLTISHHLASQPFSPSYNAGAGSPHELAKLRCRTKQTFPGGGAGTLSKKSGFYVCFDVKPPPGATLRENSIFSSPPVFMEVYYSLWNFQQNPWAALPICDDFTNPKSWPIPGSWPTSFYARGAQIYYTVYWKKMNASPPQYFFHNGVIFANTHD